MPIITRIGKGRALTFQELDNNFIYLDNKVVTGGSGNTNVADFLAAELLVASRLVAIIGGRQVPYDASNRAHAGALLGVALTTANPSQLAKVSLSGPATVIGWGLSPDVDYFAGPSGVLVRDPTGLAFAQLIGRALSADTLLYEPQLSFPL